MWELTSPHSGPCDVSLSLFLMSLFLMFLFLMSLFLTTAVDYPVVRARIERQPWQRADFISKQVSKLSAPLRWKRVPLQTSALCKLTLEMVGANPNALKRRMLGVDRIEMTPSSSRDE